MAGQASISEASITCRRCGRDYLAASGAVLAACPHCGASPSPLRHHLRHNGLAAVIAVVALIVLVVGMVMPFISMSKLGTSRVFSLVGGIIELFQTGNVFIGSVLLLFSVVFPIIKLVMLLLATSSLVSMSDRARRRMHKIAVVTGKYSLLDLLVVAVMIVLVKFGEFAEVGARPGTILFCVAVLLSIVAGLCVNFDETKAEGGP
jgi:paraquat-inducible protein A